MEAQYTNANDVQPTCVATYSGNSVLIGWFLEYMESHSITPDMNGWQVGLTTKRILLRASALQHIPNPEVVPPKMMLAARQRENP